MLSESVELSAELKHFGSLHVMQIHQLIDSSLFVYIYMCVQTHWCLIQIYSLLKISYSFGALSLSPSFFFSFLPSSLIHFSTSLRHGFAPCHHYPKCSWNHRECNLPLLVLVSCKGSVEQFSPAPYLATLINCMVWVVYGLPMVHPNSTLVVTINGTGTAIEIVYLTLFLIYCHDKKKRVKVMLIVLVEIIFIVGVTALVLIIADTTQPILFNIMMYAAPLSVMVSINQNLYIDYLLNQFYYMMTMMMMMQKLVITTKSVEYMPFFLSLASFANGVAWTAYAFLPFDPFIAVPNGLGTLFSLAQLLLYATYYKSTKRIIAARQEAKMEMHLSEVVVNGDNKDPKKNSTAP
ncbi:hypothetical protein CXB51_007992 [Gossypium anomalum]|uniref:Bidirectional sugar transporter SWEET n=1 Tax=Gossypium anomalum TaxID=47600 RepID=A0A8J5ZCN9_9ROSI|nr:hypothetical protein CXB51_007992 [Gossypium anomalum]